MANEDTLSQEQVSSSIVAGMGFVFDLFNEMGGFIRYVQDALEASDLDVSKPLNPRLTVAKKKRVKRSFADRCLRTDFGLIVQIEADQSQEDQLEDDELDDELEDEEHESRRSRRKVSIASDTQLIAIHASLYDPRKVDKDGFRPCVTGAILASLQQTEVAGRRRKKTRSAAGSPKPRRKFEIAANHLSRLLAYVEPGLVENHRISCNVPRAELSAAVSGAVQRDLASFDSEERIDEFVQTLVKLAG